MEQACTFLRTLVQKCSGMEATSLQLQSLSHLTPAAAQNLSLENSACTTFVMESVKKGLEDPSTQIIHDLQRAWNYIIMRDNHTSSPTISPSVDAATLKWLVTVTTAAVSVIDDDGHCWNADQKLLMAAESLKRQLNVALRSQQYLAAHPERSTARTLRKHIRQVLWSLEATIVEVLMGDGLPEEVLDRVRLDLATIETNQKQHYKHELRFQSPETQLKQHLPTNNQPQHIKINAKRSNFYLKTKNRFSTLKDEMEGNALKNEMGNNINSTK
ncbi:hypothetical protein FHG87_019022, partial [Trinorchestia longiramus]